MGLWSKLVNLTMEFKLLCQSVREACQNSPILIIVVVVGLCVSIFIIIDAHRNKKRRARHRWK